MVPPDTPEDEKGYGSPVAQTSVRMPDDLFQRAKDAAKRDGVSLNLWLCTAVAEKVAGSLRTEDGKRLDALEQRVQELEREI